MRILLAAAAILLASCSAPDRVVPVKPDDAKINAAIDEARASLPQFWSRFDAHDPATSEFRIKAALDTTHGGVEHIWVDVTAHDTAAVQGKLANDPGDLGDLKFGSPVRVPVEKISDWSYFKGGKMYGAYTVRAMLDRVTPEERRQADTLSATPLEPNAL